MSPGRDAEAGLRRVYVHPGILFFRDAGQLFAKTWSDNVNSPARGTLRGRHFGPAGV